MSARAYVKQVQGITVVGKAASNHWVVMDGPETFGGSNAGPRPKELVLVSLGGCTASDVASVLAKKRVKFDTLEVHVTAEEAEEYPRVYTTIHLEFVVHGHDIRPEDVARAIELSDTKYCPVAAMLRPNVTITTSYRIETPALAAT